MLRRVLGVGSDELTIDVFEQLVTNQQVEHQKLEYKAELPGNSRDDRMEFARDVASMANYQAEGQIVEYWFLDVEGTTVMVEANSFPVSFAEDVTELRAVIDTLVITP